MTTAADDSNSGRSAAADPLAVATPDIVNLTLIRRNGTFAVLKLDPFCEEHVSAAASLLVGAADDDVAFIARTPTEVSAVVGSDKVRRIHAATCAQAAVVVDDGWACFMVEGTMAFSIVGVMARLRSHLRLVIHELSRVRVTSAWIACHPRAGQRQDCRRRLSWALSD